jgi:hypothetical protein
MSCVSDVMRLMLQLQTRQTDGQADYRAGIQRDGQKGKAYPEYMAACTAVSMQ